MRKNKRYFLVIVLSVLITVISIFYKPIKENQVYSKNINLYKDVGLQKHTIDEKNLTSKAVKSFKELLYIDIDQSKFNTYVEFEAYRNKSIARVSFFDKESGEIIYSISYNTSSGEICDLFQKSIVKSADNVYSKEQLEKVAKTFLYNATSLKSSDINYDGYINANNYVVTISTKKYYSNINISINIYSGKVISYLNY